MKILQVIESLTRGGAERLVVELAREFAAMGHESRVLCLAAPGQWAGELERDGLYAGALGKHRGVDLGCAARLAGFVRGHAPDVVNTHLFTANLWTRLAGLGRRKWASVVTLHNIDNWRGPVHRLADLALARVADRYVACGASVAGYYARQGIPADRLRTIPNAVRWNGLGSHEPLAAVCPTIRAVGRLVPQKGFDVLIAAAGMLMRRGVDFRMEIIGDGPARRVLVRKVEEAGLASRVIFEGERDDARRLIAEADVFVLPSLREGLPLVLLEAMHAGRPVVATRLAALEGVVRDGREAILVEPGSPESLAEGLRRAMRESDSSLAMAAAARTRAREHFSIERAAASYVALYEEAIARRAS